MGANPRFFLSYARHDDRQSNGFITSFVEVLRADVKTRSGKWIEVYFDRKSNRLGDNWRSRVDSVAREADYLIAFVSPSFLESVECRREVELFAEAERRRGRDNSILPVYFLVTDDWSDPEGADSPEISGLVRLLKSRQAEDFRGLHDAAVTSDAARTKIWELAGRIAERLRHDRAAIGGSRPPPVHPLPTFVPARVMGRGDVIRALAAALDAPDAVVTALVGEAGIGKTAVVTHFARNLTGVAVDYLAARGYPALNAASVLAGLAGAHPDVALRTALLERVRDRDLSVLAKLDAVLNSLGAHPALVVLDDVEQLLDDGCDLRDGTLLTLLEDLQTRRGHRVQVLLVTTRKPNRPRAEQVRIVDGLPSDDLREFVSGLGRLEMSAHQWTLFTGVTHSWPRPVERIHGVVAGGRTTLQTVLDNVLEGRPLGEITAARLDRTELDVARTLAIYGRPVPRAAVVELTDEPDGDRIDEVLAGLADRRIVRREAGPSGEDRFSLPFAERSDFLAVHGGRTVELHRRAAEFFYRRAREVEIARTPNDLADLESFLDAIDLYLDCGDGERALDLAKDIDDRFLKGWGQSWVLMVHLQRLLRMLTDSFSLALAGSILARAHLQQGKPTKAAELIVQAGSRIAPLGDDVNQLTLLNQLGTAYLAQGLVGAAIEQFQEAVVPMQSGPGLPSRADARFNLANCLTELGEFDAARQSIANARDDLDEATRAAIPGATVAADNDRLRAQLLLAEARIALERGNYPASIDLAGRARSGAQAVGARVLAGRCDDLRAWAFLCYGDRVAAMTAALAARQVAAETGHPDLARLNGTTLALLHLQNGERDDAFAAADLAVRSSHSRPGALAYAMRGIVEWRLKKRHPAAADFNRALQMAQRTSDREPDVYDALDVILLAQAGLTLTGSAEVDEDAALRTYQSVIALVDGAGVEQRRRHLVRVLVADDPEALPRLRALLQLTTIL